MMKNRKALFVFGLLSWAGCGAGGDPPQSVLLITLDTTRADALSCYGGRPGLTPNLERLAAEGVLFENARTVAPLTGPSHASMLTGLYPLRHGVRVNAMRLPGSAATLAEAARASGMDTAAFLAAPVLSGELGFAQGFEVYEAPGGAGSSAGEEEGGHGETTRIAALVARMAIRWLRQRDPGAPFFLWLHFFDPHHPYNPPPAFLERGGGDPYLAEIAYMDHHIGRVLDVLEEEGLGGETLVCVVGDHGEGRGEHGEETHGTCLFDSTLRVPFIIRHADRWGSGRRHASLVSVVDVFPTMLEGIGASTSSRQSFIDGESLFKTFPSEDRGVYFETYQGHVSFSWSHLSGWVDREGKYVHAAAPEFYSVDDSNEQTNTIDALGRDVERYVGHIAEVRSRSRLDSEDAIEIDELQSQIAALGYSGTQSEKSELPDVMDVAPERPHPHGRIADATRYQEAHRLMNRKQSSQALPLLAAILEADPTNHGALHLLGTAHMREGRLDEAIAALKRALSVRAGRFAAARKKLARCYEEAGETELALAQYRTLVADGERSRQVLARFLKLLRDTGREDEALRLQATLGG